MECLEPRAFASYDTQLRAEDRAHWKEGGEKYFKIMNQKFFHMHRSNDGNQLHSDHSLDLSCSHNHCTN